MRKYIFLVILLVSCSTKKSKTLSESDYKVCAEELKTTISITLSQAAHSSLPNSKEEKIANNNFDRFNQKVLKLESNSSYREQIQELIKDPIGKVSINEVSSCTKLQ